MEFIAYPDADLMMVSLADRIAADLRQALTGGGRATLAVPGGTTPGPIFDVLAVTTLDWGRVDVLLTDERWVPESSDRSNTRLLRQRLLTGHAAAARLVPLFAEAAMPEDQLDALEAGVAAVLPLTICLLGMGADMHTASIFAGADRLDQALSGPRLIEAMRAPGAPEPRVTLTAPVLQGALQRHIAIIGQAKRDALDRARHLTPQQAPIAAVLRGATVHWAEG